MKKKLTDNQKKQKLADLRETELIIKAVVSHYTCIHRDYQKIRDGYQTEIKKLQDKTLLLDHNYEEAPQKLKECDRDLKEIADKRAGLKDVMGRMEKLKKLKLEVKRLEAELCTHSLPSRG